MGYIYLLLFLIQLFVIIYNITLYRYGLIRHIKQNDSTKYKNMLYLDVNEMDDEWGQFVNIEMI
jgi:hypothetical protein